MAFVEPFRFELTLWPVLLNSLDPKFSEPELPETVKPLFVKLLVPAWVSELLLPLPRFVFVVVLVLVKPVFVPNVTDVLPKLWLPAWYVPEVTPGPFCDALKFPLTLELDVLDTPKPATPSAPPAPRLPLADAELETGAPLGGVAKAGTQSARTDTASAIWLFIFDPHRQAH